MVTVKPPSESADAAGASMKPAGSRLRTTSAKTRKKRKRADTDSAPIPHLGSNAHNSCNVRSSRNIINAPCSILERCGIRQMLSGHTALDAAQHSHASVRDLEWQDRERRTPFAVCFCNPEASRTQHHSTRKNELPRVGKRFREFFWRAIARFRKSAHTFVQNGT